MDKMSHQYEVKSTERIKKKQGIIVDENSLTANGKKVPMSCKVNLVDAKANLSVKKLYAYLKAVSQTDCVLYGHQNDTWYKVGNTQLSNSDTKDVTGSIAAVVGIDALALMGNEYPGNQGGEKITDNKERIKACAKLTKQTIKEGAIITLSAHMPNYRIMALRSENQSISEFEERYPGDAYVDMVGFDMYHPMPKIGDHFIEEFTKELDIVGSFAKAHHKLFAVTETGVANGEVVLFETGNERKDWYNEILEAVSKTNASYFLLWANFGKEHHYTPYVTEENNGVLIGHEMLDGFIKFYNNPKSIFAKEQGDFSKLEIKNCQSSLLY